MSNLRLGLGLKGVDSFSMASTNLESLGSKQFALVEPGQYPSGSEKLFKPTFNKSSHLRPTNKGLGWVSSGREERVDDLSNEIIVDEGKVDFE